MLYGGIVKFFHENVHHYLKTCVVLYLVLFKTMSCSSFSCAATTISILRATSCCGEPLAAEILRFAMIFIQHYVNTARPTRTIMNCAICS